MCPPWVGITGYNPPFLSPWVGINPGICLSGGVLTRVYASQVGIPLSYAPQVGIPLSYAPQVGIIPGLCLSGGYYTRVMPLRCVNLSSPSLRPVGYSPLRPVGYSPLLHPWVIHLCYTRRL